MKSASPALIALLNSGQQFVMADCFTITLLSGAVLRYTSWDQDVAYNGNVFSSTGPAIERSRVRLVLGVEVDTLDLKIYPSSNDLVAGKPFLQAAVAGVFDGASMTLERVFMDTAFAVVGGFIHFSGRIADVTATRSECSMTVNSDLELLNVQMPRNIYQPGCLHTLYDGDCGLVRSAWAVTGTVQSGSTAGKILCGLSNPAGYFDLGYLQFTSGALIGIKRTVKSYTPGVVNPLNPFPGVPAVGDTFAVFPGCDKTQATCKAKFNNLANFRGFPYIPVPETSL